MQEGKTYRQIHNITHLHYRVAIQLSTLSYFYYAVLTIAQKFGEYSSSLTCR